MKIINIQTLLEMYGDNEVVLCGMDTHNLSWLLNIDGSDILNVEIKCFYNKDNIYTKYILSDILRIDDYVIESTIKNNCIYIHINRENF